MSGAPKVVARRRKLLGGRSGGSLRGLRRSLWIRGGRLLNRAVFRTRGLANTRRKRLLVTWLGQRLHSWQLSGRRAVVAINVWLAKYPLGELAVLAAAVLIPNAIWEAVAGAANSDAKPAATKLTTSPVLFSPQIWPFAAWFLASGSCFLGGFLIGSIVMRLRPTTMRVVVSLAGISAWALLIEGLLGPQTHLDRPVSLVCTLFGFLVSTHLAWRNLERDYHNRLRSRQLIDDSRRRNLRIAVVHYPPISSVGGVPQRPVFLGPFPEAMGALLRRLHLRYDFVQDSLAGCLRQLESGEVDVVLPILRSVTREKLARSRYLFAEQPFVKVPLGIVYVDPTAKQLENQPDWAGRLQKIDSPESVDLASLIGVETLRFAVNEREVAHEVLLERNVSRSRISVNESGNLLGILGLIVTDEADVAMADLITINRIREKAERVGARVKTRLVGGVDAFPCTAAISAISSGGDLARLLEEEWPRWLTQQAEATRIKGTLTVELL